MRKGFTLAELTLAVGLLAMMMVGAFSMLSTSMLAGSRAEIRTQASQLAQSLLEQQRDRPFEELKAERLTELEEVRVQAAILKPTLEYIPRGPLAIEVRVRIDWQNKGQESQVENATVIARVIR